MGYYKKGGFFGDGSVLVAIIVLLIILGIVFAGNGFFGDHD